MSAPWALLGLLLIPVLILLERWRRRPRAIVWPSLLLWKEIGPGEATRRRRIEPLLVMECVAVLLLSLAAAGPSLRAGRAGRLVVVNIDTSLRMGARLPDGRTALAATRAELERIRGALAPEDEWREFEGVDEPPATGDIRILATNRPGAAGKGYLVVGRAPTQSNIGIDAVEWRAGRLGFSVHREQGRDPVLVSIGGKKQSVVPDRWIETEAARELRILEPNAHPGDDTFRLRPVRLKVRTDVESPLVLAALRVGVPSEEPVDENEPADLVLVTTGGTPVGRLVRGTECIAAPGIFEGLFLDDCRWEGARAVDGPGLLTWRGRTLARWRSETTLWLGLPVTEPWDGHGTLAVVLERAKRERARTLLRQGEELAGEAAVLPAPGFIETAGIDRPWNGVLPNAPAATEGSFALRALLATAALGVLLLYAVHLGRS